MSHTRHDLPEAGIGGDHLYPPQSVPTQVPQGVSNFADGSGLIFSMYSEMATEEDKKMAENWKADADGILIFTGLFSAAVASLISVSIQDIRQNPQDTSNFYLANIYQTLADPSRSNVTTSLPASPPPFSPPTYAVWVNALWFLSLVISLTCALLATLLQQWARRYLKVTQSRYSPHKRSRIRAFLAEGVDKLLLPWTVEALPTLLHVSLFLFFAGLVVFLWNVDLTIFKLVLSWVGVCTALYGCITVMPIFRHDSPYHTPLSLPAWHIVTGIQFLTFRALHRLALPMHFSRATWFRFWNLGDMYGKWLVQGIQKTVEEAALKSPSGLDTRAFLWTFDCLDEDHELERFFSGLPGFRSSKFVEDPLPSLTNERKEGLFAALIGLLDRTLSSDLLPGVVKDRRVISCTKAIDPAESPDARQWILSNVFSQHEGLLTAEVGHIVRGWRGILNHPDTEADVTAILTFIVSKAQQHNDSWFILASKELKFPEPILRNFAAHGDSLSLAILIHVTRGQFNHIQKWTRSWPCGILSTVLSEASKIDVQGTLPELQHEFCALWNQIVRTTQNDTNLSMAFYVLTPIRSVYIALHRGTDSAPTQFSPSTGDRDYRLLEPSSYPLCNIPDHHPDSTSHIHDHSASATFVPAVSHHPENIPPDPSFFSSFPDTRPLPVDESLADAQPPDNNTSTSVSLRPVDQTTTGGRPIPAASPNPFNTCMTHGIKDTLAYISTPETSASTHLPGGNVSTTPPDAVTVEHPADNCYPSLDVPSSPSPAQVLDDILPTGPPLISDFLVAATFAPAAPHDDDNTAPVPSFQASIPGTRPLFTDDPLCVDESPVGVPPVDSNVPVSVSLHPVDQTTTESPRIHDTSSNLVSTHATQGIIDTSARTTHLSTTERSALVSAPRFKTSQPDTVAIEHTADRRTPLDNLDILSSTRHTPVLDDILPPEYHLSTLARATPFASPPPSTSAPDLGAAAEDEGNQTVGLRKDRDAPHASLTTRENIAAVPEPPLHLSLAPSVTSVAVAGPSERQSLDVKHTEDHPPPPSHVQDDIV